MTIGHHYFCSKWYTSAMAMTPLHGGAAGGLKGTTHPHCFAFFSEADCGEIGKANFTYFDQTQLPVCANSVLETFILTQSIAKGLSRWCACTDSGVSKMTYYTTIDGCT